MVNFVYSADYQNERQLIDFGIQKLKEHSWYRDVPLNCWGFKMPSLVPYSVQPITNFLNEFPRGKIILIWRDPRGFYNSHKTLWRGRLGREPGIFESLRYAIRSTAEIEECYWGMRNEIPSIVGERCLFVRYEDLVKDTEKEMRGICDFLGIEFSEVLTQPTVFGAPASVRTARTAENPSKVSSRSVDKWKREMASWEISLVNAISRRHLEGECGTAADWAFRWFLYCAWAFGFAAVSQRSGTPFCRSQFGRGRQYYQAS